ncbi:hypothetical protein M3M30_04690 [Methylococcus capsulatus]|nr:hypothetical protein [Methylococcus capsulatus]QXP89091.1 hypothetical protein KW112_02975 [Methylococcus capsulatus]UQN13154.1 hypothetical protein M3M30_04690 [Methylococcus capsulatus]
MACISSRLLRGSLQISMVSMKLSSSRSWTGRLDHSGGTGQCDVSIVDDQPQQIPTRGFAILPAEDTEVYPPHFRQTQQVGVTAGNALDAGAGIQDQSAPFAGMRQPLQVEEDFGEQAPIQRVVGLKLDFDENMGVVAVFDRRQHAIDPESGLFELFGPEAVVSRPARVEASQIEDHRRPLTKEFMKQCVGLHNLPST